MPSSGGVIAYLTPEEKARLEKVAKREDRSNSWIARQAILQYLDREEKKKR